MFQQFQNRSAGICRFVYDYVWEIAMMTLGDMRQSTGWYFLLIAGWMLIMGLPTFAQNQSPPPLSPRDPIFEKLRPDEIIKQAQERFQKAQNKEQVESVKMWCKDKIAELTFHEAGRLLLEAKTLLDAHKTVEARSRIERLQALDEATKRLASEVCKLD